MLSNNSLLAIVFVCCALFVTAPSHAVAADTKATGKVVLEDKPLAEGKVTFHLDNGQFIGSKLKKDGSYKTDRLPPGKYKVTVEGKGVPAQFTSEDKTPLVVMVEGNEINLDFNLK